MTPHAPCTPNCSQKAPAESPLNVLGRIQSGMNAPESKTKIMMVRRRPMYCDTKPAIAPPLLTREGKKRNSKKKGINGASSEEWQTYAMAPQFPMMVATVAW